MLTFMLTCATCTSYVTSLGWGVGDVHVHVNLHQCTSYVTSLGWCWMNSKTKSLMEVTGRALKDRVAM